MKSKVISWSIAAVRSTGRLGAIFIVLDGLVLALTFIFTLSIAAYFGHSNLGIVGRFLIEWTGLKPELLFSSMAAAAAILALASRLGQTATEAKIVVAQELRFAYRLRRKRPKNVAPGIIARASNHYGRLCAAAVKLFSAIVVLLGSLGFLFITLSGLWRIASLAAILVFVLLGYGAFRFLSVFIATASSDLVFHAKETSRWKTGVSRDLASVRAYSKAYFKRLFLPSVFSIAPLIFASMMSLVLVYLTTTEYAIDLGSAFIAFMMAHAYLAIVGRAFNNAMGIAAFLPAVLQAFKPESSINVSSIAETTGYEDDLTG